jgi:hypothetical protein
MIVDDTGSTIKGIDDERNVVTFHLVGRGEEPDEELPPTESDLLDDDLDGRIGVTVDELRGPDAFVELIDLESDERTKIDPGESVRFGKETIAHIYAPVRVLLRPHESVQLRKTTDGTLIQGDEVGVDIGFLSRIDWPEETVVVPETPEGIARYVTVVGRSISDKTSPLRSWPINRQHPPSLEFDEEFESPVEEQVETALEIEVPEQRALERVFAVAPLAVYLGADVQIVEGRDATTLTGFEWSRTIGETPEETDEVASSFLRRVFYLDCIRIRIRDQIAS